MDGDETRSKEEDSLLQRGVEPTVLEDLKESQAEYRKKGIEMTLEEVYEFEVETPLDEL